MVHCELNKGNPFDPEVKVNQEWYTNVLGYPREAQVVFYCDNGEDRSVNLGRWYKKQVLNNGTPQKVYLLFNGISKSLFATELVKNGAKGKLDTHLSCMKALANLLLVVDWKPSMKRKV